MCFMKIKSLLLIIACVFPLTVFAKQIKVACIGNSITYGAYIQNREKNAYPAQLQELLGNNYNISNFGVNGSTIHSEGDYPYINTNEYHASLELNPDIILIKLGTNDSKPQNWKNKAELKSNYLSIINKYRRCKSNPRIILLTPIKCFSPKGSEINASIIDNEIHTAIEELAFEQKLEIINLQNIFDNNWQSHLIPDKIHPSSIGCGTIAQKIYQYIIASNEKTAYKVEHKLNLKQAKKFNFHGYQGYEFTVNNSTCYLVAPNRPAKGNPWLIRARFWGHEPQTDIALLENGFFITYCDVANLYGSDKAIERWNNFYQKMRKAGLDEKVVLEGMSRGGLIVYNWAAQNTEKVACIYADAPVMDIKSWPMGKGMSAGSDTDTKQLFEAYGFKDEQEALSWNKNPLNAATNIAKAQIPILHVVGETDSIVPVIENTAIFEKRMDELGAPIQVISKPGIGHHPHSLYNPESIVQFILNATKRAQNLCIVSVPGNEFRSAAGWSENADWHDVASDISKTLSNYKDLNLLLLGNSITQGWGGTRKLVTYKPGKAIMDSIVGDRKWESAGISGDKTQNLLWRIKHGNYNIVHPANIIITIGINNLLAGDMPTSVAEGIVVVANETAQRFPDSRIILLGPLPSGKNKNDEIRLKCDEVHKILANSKLHKIEYINPSIWFYRSDASLDPNLYGSDYIHLTQAGYKLWAEKIAELIN